ncbi:MAG: SEC-C domain-containing protein [candidate division Zixibacteria bacterium]
MRKKIGRNERCPCGSGRKYKKCHLASDLPPPKPTGSNSIPIKSTESQDTVPTLSPHYFRLKGKKAEEMVAELAHATFLSDWCYLNPKLTSGKEICDLLVIFDTIAIVWQVKNLKLGKDGKYKKSDVEKNVRQLSGARRRLFEIRETIELENPRRGKESFNPDTIQEVFLISVLFGEGEDFFSLVDHIRSNTVHVFTRAFTEIIMNELDTVSDFINYLRVKESLLNREISLNVTGGEEELLAFYILNDRSFKRFRDLDMVMLEEGAWALLQKKPEYKAKQDADRISYYWDSIINRAHEGGVPEYELIARELARPNRLMRRVLAQSFYDGQVKAHSSNLPLLRRLLSVDGVTYCFLFQESIESRGLRKRMLELMCFVGRGIYQHNKRVLGIATEKQIRSECSFDFIFIDIPEWTKEMQKEMKSIQKENGIFVNLTKTNFHADEYPDLN